ncbi:LOW QUALITY PROTEIN: 3,4-dihydroxy-2-butanone-4-phosphate synthase/GTP cyclohydrolase II, partial [Micromonospora sp. M42]
DHFRIDRAGGGGHRRRAPRGRGRRRGPRERGRPDLRGRAGHPGAGRVHGPLHLRLHLRAADRGRVRPAGPAADAPHQPGPARHRVHRDGGRPGGRQHRHLGRRPVAHHPAARRRPTDPTDLARPGHVVPLRARAGGVLRRPGHTEAAVDLTRMAGLRPAGVLCELVNDDGTMMRLPDLEKFCAEHGLTLVTIADLIAYRRRTEKQVELAAEARMPTPYGVFKALGYRAEHDPAEHVALVMGELGDGRDVLVRVHSECLTGDVFGSLRCDCGPQLQAALARVAAEGRGVVLYVRGHEGRGIGLLHKLQAYQLQDQGRDTVDANLDLGLPADARDYGTGAQILYDLGVRSMRLLTNNPAKRAGLEGYGLTVTGREGLPVRSNPENVRYLRTKRDRMGHLLDGLDEVTEAPMGRPVAGDEIGA